MPRRYILLASAFVALTLPGAALASHTRLFTPEADAYVSAASPRENFGTRPRLRARSTSPRMRSYLRFDVRALDSAVEAAYLDVFVLETRRLGFQVRRVANNRWGERAITFANAPRIAETVTTRSGAMRAGRWIRLDITELVAQGGRVSLALTSSSRRGVSAASREARHMPRLLVETYATHIAAPNGTFSTSEADWSSIAALDFDFGVASAYRTYLDAAAARGVRVLVWLGGYANENGQVCAFNWSDDKVRERIAEVRGHPAILAYFIDDEPHAECPNAPAQIRARSELVKLLDPGVPTLISENRASDFDELANTTDIMLLIIYPCNHADGCVYSKISERVQAAEAAGVARYWGAVQSFGDEYYRVPTAGELETLFERWHATRAERLVAYTWDCCGDPDTLQNHPELWDGWRVENGKAQAPGPAPAPAPPPPPPSPTIRTETLHPVADARVEESRPGKNFGAASRLKTDGRGGARVESVLRFDLSRVTGTIQHATLRLHAGTDGTIDGPAVYPTSGGWRESSVTWKTRPTATGTAIVDLGGVGARAWFEVDVTSLASGPTVELLLKQAGRDALDIYSLQSTLEPELVVTTVDSS